MQAVGGARQAVIGHEPTTEEEYHWCNTQRKLAQHYYLDRVLPLTKAPLEDVLPLQLGVIVKLKGRGR